MDASSDWTVSGHNTSLAEQVAKIRVPDSASSSRQVSLSQRRAMLIISAPSLSSELDDAIEASESKSSSLLSSSSVKKFWSVAFGRGRGMCLEGVCH